MDRKAPGHVSIGAEAFKHHPQLLAPMQQIGFIRVEEPCLLDLDAPAEITGDDFVQRDPELSVETRELRWALRKLLECCAFLHGFHNPFAHRGVIDKIRCAAHRPDQVCFPFGKLGHSGELGWQRNRVGLLAFRDLPRPRRRSWLLSLSLSELGRLLDLPVLRRSPSSSEGSDSSLDERSAPFPASSSSLEVLDEDELSSSSSGGSAFSFRFLLSALLPSFRAGSD